LIEENSQLRQRFAKENVASSSREISVERRQKKPLEDITPRHLNNVGDRIAADIRKERDCKYFCEQFL
jgi:hypothetical protein